MFVFAPGNALRSGNSDTDCAWTSIVLVSSLPPCLMEEKKGKRKRGREPFSISSHCFSRSATWTKSRFEPGAFAMRLFRVFATRFIYTTSRKRFASPFLTLCQSARHMNFQPLPMANRARRQLQDILTSAPRWSDRYCRAK